MAVEDDVVVIPTPTKLHDYRCVALSHFVQCFVQTLGRVYNFRLDEMVRYDVQVLVGDYKRNVVSVVDDAGDKRILGVVAYIGDESQWRWFNDVVFLVFDGVGELAAIVRESHLEVAVGAVDAEILSTHEHGDAQEEGEKDFFHDDGLL